MARLNRKRSAYRTIAALGKGPGGGTVTPPPLPLNVVMSAGVPIKSNGEYVVSTPV